MVRIIVVVVLCLIAAIAVWHPAQPVVTSTSAPPALASNATVQRHRVRPASTVIVYVAGSVRRPGVYALPSTSRVIDAVARAGGLLPSADPLAVNLAARISDGDEIAVVAAGASLPPERSGRTRKRRTTHPQKRAADAASANVNTSDAQSLALVPGIGATIARRIVALREAEGPFDSLDELLDVAGMTPARLERARSNLSI